MSYNTYDCIDAGTENCPCYLALTGDCLTCSRLQGKDCCDCNWRGVCIYNEFVQGNRKVNNPRTEFEAKILEKKFYLDDLVIFILDVGKGFAIKASHPGSYVFLRGRQSSHFYDLPISVMRADVEKGTIHVAVKIIALKTKALLEEPERFVLRGVYRNGIQGVSALRPSKTKDQKILFIAKGIGVAPAILAANALRYRNKVDFVLDTEKISTELISDYLGEKGNHEVKEINEENGAVGELGIIKYLTLNNEQDRRDLVRLLKKENYDCVAVLASDYFVDTIGALVRKTLPGVKLANSNNFHICCGEGVCGACSFVNEEGDTIRMCKCQRRE
ncbi:MAG: hypothetical protein VB095_06700 [Anaerovorax sp.]|nr:hypothetical protein [Anaerovorax sp.]